MLPYQGSLLFLGLPVELSDGSNWEVQGKGEGTGEMKRLAHNKV